MNDMQAMMAKHLDAEDLEDIQFEDVTKNHREAVTLITSRAPELVEQYKATPEVLISLAKAIEELEPLPLVPEQPSETPFPTEALLGMDEAVNAIANIMKFPAAMVAQSALGLANGIIQGLVNVLLPGKPAPSPVSLFLLTGAESGEGKTHSDNILSSRIEADSNMIQREYENKLEDYKLRKRAYDAEVKKIEKDKQLDLDGRLQKFRELKEPSPPMNPRHKASDFTIEGLRTQYQTGCTRLSIMTDEGAVWLGGHALANDRCSSVMSQICTLWDGGRWDVDRGSPESSYSLKGRRLAISMSTQPLVLQSLMGDVRANDQGLLARFLIAIPDSRINDRKMSSVQWNQNPNVTGYWAKLSKLYAITPPTEEEEPLRLTPRTLEMDGEAQRIYMGYGDGCFQRIKKDYAPIRALALKANEHLARLAATLTTFNEPAAEMIDKDAMEAACYLVDYYLKEMIRIVNFGKGHSKTSYLSMASRLLNWANKKGLYLVYSQILHNRAPEIDMRNKNCIEKMMEILVDHGHAIVLQKGTVIDGSKRKKTWLITS